MEEAIKISVIVVCYNEESTIERTLDSILSQEDAPRYEILVSDDASTDGTARIASEYATRYPGIVKLHINKTNKGVQENYFGALKRAEGEYIADCAGDDYWSDTRKLAKEANILDSRPEVSIVHTGFDYLYPDGHSERFEGKTDIRERVSSRAEGLETVLCGEDKPFIHLCTSLYRKTPVLKGLREYPELFLDPEWGCEDLQTEAFLAAAGEVAYIPESTLEYSVGHTSISSEESYGKTFDFYFGTTRLRLALMRHFGIGREKMDRTLRRYTSYLMSQAFRSGSRLRIEKLREWMRGEGISPTIKDRLYMLAAKAGGIAIMSRLVRVGKA